MIVPTYEVRAFPTGRLLHVAPTFEAADNWRLRFHQAASVIPHWKATPNVSAGQHHSGTPTPNMIGRYGNGE
jgi:hypothetical protein